MGMDEGEGGYGESGDPMDRFHRNEAISAVADDGFLAEEDDDYEDLYNDVNVGEGFLQSLRKNEDLGFRNREVVDEKRVQSQPVAPDPVADRGDFIPGVGGGTGETGTGGGDAGSRVSARADGFQNQGLGGNNGMGTKGTGAGGSGSGIVSGGGMRVELGQPSGKLNEMEEQSGNNIVGLQGVVHQPHGGAGGGNIGGVSNEVMVTQGAAGVGGGRVSVNGVGGNRMGNAETGIVTGGGGGGGGVPGPGAGVGSGGGAGVGGGGGTILFVGDLHWWTTDAELEAELCKYGPVKEVKFFDEKASGKSKGYCQVEFYDPAVAATCKEGMNGYAFNGRSCVVAFASPFSIKRMGEAQVNRNQQMGQSGANQTRRGANEAGGKTGGSNIATGGNYQGGDNNRVFGRGNWGGRGNGPVGNRGPVGPMRNRAGGMGGRGLMTNIGNGFGQGVGGTPPLLPPQSMMGQGFDPAFPGPMGRMGNYGGFPGGPTPPFSGVLSSFPPMGGVGLPGIAPHVNPAFFGRGMPMNGMGMVPAFGVEGPNMGMWSDPSMGGWGGEDHGGGRAGESSYGEEAASDHQYGEVSHDRGGWPNSMKEKDVGSERDWSGSSDRRYRDDREQGYDKDALREKDVGHDPEWSERKNRDDRDMARERDRDGGRDRERSRDRNRERDRERDRHRDDKDRYADHHRYKDRDADHDDDWDRGKSSRTHSKSRISQEEDHHRSRSRDSDYGKRRRLASE